MATVTQLKSRLKRMAALPYMIMDAVFQLTHLLRPKKVQWKFFLLLYIQVESSVKIIIKFQADFTVLAWQLSVL